MGRGQLHNGELRERPLRPFHRRRVRKGNPMIKDSSMSPSKPPTRRTTIVFRITVHSAASKPPTRRTTRTDVATVPGVSSKPPTRRTTTRCRALESLDSSKPPTRRTTGAIRDNIFIFQRITYWHPPIASSASPLFNYFIPKGFSEQLFYEAKRKLQKR